MNDSLRERILRKLDALSDERGYQVLDYVEFLESRFAERQSTANAFTRFTEAVEDKLRAGRVSASAISETMSLLNRAANVLNGVAAAGKSVASDFVSGAQPGRPSGTSGTTGASNTPTSPPPKNTGGPAPDSGATGSGGRT
jgi:hypothetical protein